MNKQRKNQIKEELDKLRAMKRSLRAEPPTRGELKEKLQAVKDTISKIHDAEEDDYEKMSEKQQCSTAGEMAEEGIALLEDALDYMDELVSVSIEDNTIELTELGDPMDDVIDLLDELYGF